jgi:hypothetical protein
MCSYKPPPCNPLSVKSDGKSGISGFTGPVWGCQEYENSCTIDCVWLSLFQWNLHADLTVYKEAFEGKDSPEIRLCVNAFVSSLQWLVQTVELKKVNTPSAAPCHHALYSTRSVSRAKHHFWVALSTIKLSDSSAGAISSTADYDAATICRRSRIDQKLNYAAMFTVMHPFHVAFGGAHLFFTLVGTCCYVPSMVKQFIPALRLNERHLVLGGDHMPGSHMTTIVLAELHKRHPEWKSTTSYVGEDAKACESCKTSFMPVRVGKNVMITNVDVAFGHHFAVQFALMALHPFKVINVKLNVHLPHPSGDLYLDRIVLLAGKHYTGYMWIVHSTVNPVRTGWYYYDGMEEAAFNRNNPGAAAANAIFVGTNSLGAHASQKITLTSLNAVYYSHYANGVSRPKLQHAFSLVSQRNPHVPCGFSDGEALSVFGGTIPD